MLLDFLAASSRIVLASIFWVAVRLFHHVKVHGLERASGKHPSFYAMAHKRDLDPLVEVPSVLARRGWQALAGDVHFAMRGDAFTPGFLARLVSYPRWFVRFLRLLSLGAILRRLGIRPLENLHVRPAEVWIHEWLETQSDRRSDQVLTLTFLQHVAKMSGEDVQNLQALPLSHLLSWHFQEALQPWNSTDIFVESARRHMKRVVLKKLKQQLTDLAAWLSHGGSLWSAPEGQLSTDGTLGLLTPILHRLLQEGPPDTCVIPISITYDFMSSGRSGIFVNLAPPIASPLPAKELETQLRHIWLLHACFSCTQLASGFLVEKQRAADPSFTLDDLASSIQQHAARLAEAGRFVDQRLLNPRTARKLARRYVDYTLRHHIVRTTERNRWEPTIGDLVIQVRPGEVGYKQAPLAYAWNELQDMLSVSSPLVIQA
jgi:1-acyl-sn-glycerol-3-phosphate acyltransferase